MASPPCRLKLVGGPCGRTARLALSPPGRSPALWRCPWASGQNPGQRTLPSTTGLPKGPGLLPATSPAARPAKAPPRPTYDGGTAAGAIPQAPRGTACALVAGPVRDGAVYAEPICANALIAVAVDARTPARALQPPPTARRRGARRDPGDGGGVRGAGRRSLRREWQQLLPWPWDGATARPHSLPGSQAARLLRAAVCSVDESMGTQRVCRQGGQLTWQISGLSPTHAARPSSRVRAHGRGQGCEGTAPAVSARGAGRRVRLGGGGRKG